MSWRVAGDFNCIIGPGDSGKTTILTALDYALSPRFSLSVDDSDFFNQDVSQTALIQVTLCDWDETNPAVQGFFSEGKFGQYKCGLNDAGPVAEPEAGGPIAISISLKIDKSLEPKWSITKGLDESDEQDRKPIYSSDRAILGISRIDAFSDFHFTWGNNTILSRLGAHAEGNPNEVLSELAREMRQADISDHQSVRELQSIADIVKNEAENTGVRLSALSPKIDLQRRFMTSGALSLHEDRVPLRNKGSGSKKLIAAAMQLKLHDGKNVSLIDEIETGLEPHRIRGLLLKIKNSQQQIFTTTHSPVVIRELNVVDNELHVCKRDDEGNVTLQSLSMAPDIQGPVRQNAEAFLGNRIIACEGSTEVGCLRAYDTYQNKIDDLPVWSLAISYFDCHGIGKIKTVCPKLVDLGYRTAVLCDNDAPEQLSEEDITALDTSGVKVFQWEAGNSTEMQLFHDLPRANIAGLLETIAQSHDTLEFSTIVNSIRSATEVANLDLDENPENWPENTNLRQVMAKLASQSNWIKRIDYASSAFAFALPVLPDDCTTKSRLKAIWDWVQNE